MRIIYSLFVILVLGFIIALMFGKGKGFGKVFLKPMLVLFVLLILIPQFAGSFIPNVGEMFHSFSPFKGSIEYEDFSVDIPINANTNESFEHNLEYYIDKVDSDEYSPELSHMLIALCCSLDDKSYVLTALDNMGFDTSESNTRVSYNSSNSQDYVMSKSNLITEHRL